MLPRSEPIPGSLKNRVQRRTILADLIREP
jgi:hypothetical protein